MLEIVRLPAPLLVRLMFCAALVVPSACAANVRLAGVRFTSGTLELIPVPERVMVRGLPGSVSVIVKVAERAPAAAGVNVNLKVQYDSAPTCPPGVHPLPVVVKSPGFVPPSAKLLTVTVVFPWLE